MSAPRRYSATPAAIACPEAARPYPGSRPYRILAGLCTLPCRSRCTTVAPDVVDVTAPPGCPRRNCSEPQARVPPFRSPRTDRRSPAADALDDHHQRQTGTEQRGGGGAEPRPGIAGDRRRIGAGQESRPDVGDDAAAGQHDRRYQQDNRQDRRDDRARDAGSFRRGGVGPRRFVGGFRQTAGGVAHRTVGVHVGDAVRSVRRAHPARLAFIRAKYTPPLPMKQSMTATISSSAAPRVNRFDTRSSMVTSTDIKTATSTAIRPHRLPDRRNQPATSATTPITTTTPLTMKFWVRAPEIASSVSGM